MYPIEIINQRFFRGIIKGQHEVVFRYNTMDYKVHLVGLDDKVDCTFEEMTTLQYDYLDLPREVIEDHFNQIKSYIETMKSEL